MPICYMGYFENEASSFVHKKKRKGKYIAENLAKRGGLTGGRNDGNNDYYCQAPYYYLYSNQLLNQGQRPQI
jgi:hypothetical protein